MYQKQTREAKDDQISYPICLHTFKEESDVTICHKIINDQFQLDGVKNKPTLLPQSIFQQLANQHFPEIYKNYDCFNTIDHLENQNKYHFALQFPFFS